MTRTSLVAFIRERFSRVTSTGEYIAQIDGLRMFAMLMVMAHHVFAIYLENTHRLGARELPRDWASIYPRSPLVHWALDLAIGVPFFCVISGFVLTIPFARAYLKGVSPPAARLYLLRRLIRMEPPYIVYMILMFLTIVLPWGLNTPAAYFRGYARAYGPHLLASLVYLHNAVYGEASWIGGIAWTLEIEFQFYLVLPLLARVFRIREAPRRRSVLVALIAACALTSQLILPPVGHSRLSLSLAVQLHFFLAGVLLADIYLAPPRMWRPGPRVADILAISCAALLVMVLHRATQFAWTEPFLILGLCYGSFFGAVAGAVFRSPLLTVPGAMCYSIYLWHYFVVSRTIPFSIRLFGSRHALWFDSGVQFLSMLGPVLLAGAVFFACVERPFMALSHSTARRFRTRRAALSAA